MPPLPPGQARLSRLSGHLRNRTGRTASCRCRTTSTISSSSKTAADPPNYVLLTNDDGPPEPEHSPYIFALPRALVGWVGTQRLGICVPAKQQSWRSKAHIPQDTLHVDFPGPQTWAAGAELALVQGTPAAAASFGVHAFAQQHFDRTGSPSPLGHGLPLVVSGPNFGDNSGRAYMLSSGTLGAALEAALSGHRAIALSFQRSSQVRNTPGLEHTDEEVATAITLSVRLIKQLWENWPPTVELYNINVPLGVLNRYKKNNRVFFTMPATDSYGAVFKPDCNDDDTASCCSYTFESPNRDSSLASPGTDVWALHQGCISVTPMQAMHAVILDRGDDKTDAAEKAKLPAAMMV
eukprot:COSAG05_NODE_4198_length_1627_cov_2.019634_1_plen_351_part_00